MVKIFVFVCTGYLSFGRIGLILVDFNLICSQIGFCIAYTAFISENLESITSITRIEWIIILMCSWSLLCQIRSVNILAFTSLLGNIVYLVSLIIIFYDGFHNHCCSTDIPLIIDGSGLAFVFGTACFALEGIGLILPVRRAMKNQHKF